MTNNGKKWRVGGNNNRDSMGMILNWVYETKQELNNPDQVRVDCIVVEADFPSSGLHNIYSYSLLPKELGNLYFHQLVHFVVCVKGGYIYNNKNYYYTAEDSIQYFYFVFSIQFLFC